MDSEKIERALPDDDFIDVMLPLSREGRGDERTEELEYFSLEQHPKAKKIYDLFDPQKKVTDATLSEVEHFRNLFPEVELHLFFGTAPTSFDFFYKKIEHNVRSYTLWKLAEEHKVGLFAYDPSAALSGLKISATTEILTPATGRFVVTFNGDRAVVIALERHPHGVSWGIFSQSSADFSVFDTMFREAVKGYNYYKGQVFDQWGEFLALPDVSFDDIYLDENIRQEVKSNIIDYLDESALDIKRKNKIPTKRGVIFAGAPGTGKSFLSRVLANTLDTTFMVVTELSHVEEINRVFDLASAFDRVVLLFEDIDIYIKDRSMSTTLLPTMLNHLDGVEVNNHIVVICTTNDVEEMDKALKDRPGRFDRILTFKPPSEELKAVMLSGFCKEKDVSGVDFSKVVAAVPPSYTGAHLKEVYITACNYSIDAGSLTDEMVVILTTDIFLKAIDTVKTRTKPDGIGFS